MKIRKLTLSDRKTFFELSDRVVKALEHRDWLIPMTEDEADVTFAEGSDDVVLGGFVDGRLVATLGLFHDIRDYADYLPAELQAMKGAEIGEAMVDPEMRRAGLMNELWQALKETIKNRDLDFLLATAHPDNISNHLMQKDDFLLCKVFERRGYPRNMYFLTLTSTYNL